MAKEAQAFRTISEVAEELGVHKHVLRFWEQRFPQVKPMKRGGGRRYYRPEDLELLRGIRNLLHAEGYTIKGVQKILRESGIDSVKAAGKRTAADEGASGRKGARRAAKVAGRRAAPSEPKVPATPTGLKTRRQILEASIVELELCRRLLRGEPEPAAAGSKRTAKRARAARHDNH